MLLYKDVSKGKLTNPDKFLITAVEEKCDKYAGKFDSHQQ